MNKYEVLGVVGEGAYGIVLKWRNKTTDEVVAIKKFKESEEDDTVRKTTLREVKILRMLKQENIVQLKEAFRRKGKLYLVFEYVERNLLEVLEESPKGISPVYIQKYMYQLCRAIEYCHNQDIIHRDIKPENLLIGNDHSLKICDFGFARQIGGRGKLTDYVATRWYRPPELLLGTGVYAKGVDMWAIGCILAELTDGKPLIPGDSEVDQLSKTAALLGPLPNGIIKQMKENRRFNAFNYNESGQPDNIDRRYIGMLPKLAIQFMKQCLELDPVKRITAHEAVMHPYFDTIREERLQRADSGFNIRMNELVSPQGVGNNVANSKSTLRAKQRSKNASPYGLINPPKPFGGTFYKPPEVWKTTRHATKPKRQEIVPLTIRQKRDENKLLQYSTNFSKTNSTYDLKARLSRDDSQSIKKQRQAQSRLPKHKRFQPDKFIQGLPAIVTPSTSRLQVNMRWNNEEPDSGGGPSHFGFPRVEEDPYNY